MDSGGNRLCKTGRGPIDEAERAELHDIALVELARLDVVVVHPHAVARAVVGDRVAIACRLNNRVAARNRHIV